MNFMKYPTKNDISISNAVLKLAKLQKEQAELEAKFLFEQPESNHHDNTAE